MRAFAIAFLAVLLPLPSAPAETVPAQAPAGPAAFLFEYLPRPGQQRAFEEGYRRHLSWHKQAGDPLSWFGWYVGSGERAGRFIDGTFGIPFQAFDQRVNPGGDAEDFDRTAASFVEPLSRTVYRLRPDLGTALSLEKRSPSPAIEVTRIVGNAGSMESLERVFAALRGSRTRDAASPAFTWYQLISGGEQPQYLLMVPKAGWGAYDASPRSGLDLLLDGVEAARRAELGRSLREHVRTQYTETWTYRADLSLIVPREEAAGR